LTNTISDTAGVLQIHHKPRLWRRLVSTIRETKEQFACYILNNLAHNLCNCIIYIVMRARKTIVQLNHIQRTMAITIYFAADQLPW